MIIRNDMNVSYVRVFHASPDAPGVDIYVNGGLVFQNLEFKNFTEYVPLSMGEYNIDVYPTGKTGKPVLSQNIKVPSKQVITVAAAGDLDELQLVPYIEGNGSDLAVNQSLVRAIHLSPDGPNVDILVNGKAAFSDVGFLDATDYAQLMSGIYQVDINEAGTNNTVLSLRPELKSQKVYSIYVVGNPPNLSAIQSLDGITYVRF